MIGKYDSGAVFDSSDVRARKYDPKTLRQILTQVAKIRKEEVPPKTTHARLGPGLVSAASGRELRDPRL